MPYEITTTEAVISGTTATAYTKPLTGILTRIRVDVLQANGTASSNTCDVTISEDNGLGQTIQTVTGSTGTGNFYNPRNEITDATGTGTGLYTAIQLQSTVLKIAVANGTATDIVKVQAVIL